jgi:hypothetical protein
LRGTFLGAAPVEAAVFLKKPANPKTATQSRNGVSRTKLENNHVRLVREDFVGEMFLDAIRRETSHGHNLEVDVELAPLTEMLDGLMKKSGFWWKWDPVDHAGPEPFDT